MYLKDTVFLKKACYNTNCKIQCGRLCNEKVFFQNDHLLSDNIDNDNNKGKDKKTTVYKDGSGSFIVRGGVLRWTDNKESAGKELYFAYSPVQE